MKSFIVAAILMATWATNAVSQTIATPLLNAKHFNLSKGLALDGYDPVSYFNGSKPQRGKPAIKSTSDGVVYYFATAANRDLFNNNPNKYKPEYGGWCAYAMGDNSEKVAVNPETFKLVNGKLYLFYNAFFNNTLNDWNKAEASLKGKADKNWKSIFK